MDDVSLTSFIDFTLKSGPPRMTLIKILKNSGGYHPRKDFWSKLRNGIIDYHTQNKNNKRQLDRLLVGISNRTKLNNYPEAINGYKKFLGNKKITWFTPKKDKWTSNGLTVRVNPELGLKFNDKKYSIKLYFKAEKLSKNKVDIALFLMDHVLSPLTKRPPIFAVLDVRRGKLIPLNHSPINLMPLLDGEALAFKTIWDLI